MTDKPAPDRAQMTLNDHESLLRLCCELRDVIASDQTLSVEDRLVTVDRALMLAIGGSPRRPATWSWTCCWAA